MSANEFRFDLSVRKFQHSDAELLDALRAFAAVKAGQSFTRHEFDAWAHKPVTAETIVDRFGSWESALKTIGLVPRFPRPTYTAEDLILNLEQVWRELGRAPGQHLLRRRGRFSVSAYARRWGSVHRACQALAAFHAGTISRETLLKGRDDAPGPHITIDTRFRIMKRDSFKCTCCGASPATDPAVVLQVDHIHPYEQGGSSEDENLRTLCQSCNLGRRGDGEGGESEKRKAKSENGEGERAMPEQGGAGGAGGV